MNTHDEMVAIPPATVTIGSPETHLDHVAAAQHYGREWFEDETPQHRAHVRRFRLGRCLVTNGEFAAFVADTGYRTHAEERGYGLVYGPKYWEPRPGACWHTPTGTGGAGIDDRFDHPVIHVAAADAVAYASWAGTRLPTEVEWEYAAHGPEFRTWPWGDTWQAQRANCAEYWAGEAITDFAMWRRWWSSRYATCGGGPATTPAGTFSPDGDSLFGVADLAGNVAEWTASPYRLYDPHRDYDPVYAAAAGRYTVARGGGWMNFRYQLRTTERIAIDPTYSSVALGFRCAADSPD